MLNIIDQFIAAFGNSTKNSLSNFSDLETAINNRTFAAKDGSLFTIIDVKGTEEIKSKEELYDVTNDLGDSLSTYFEDEGHALQFWFARDPEVSEQIIEDNIRPARRISSELSMDLNDIFEERLRNLKNFIVWEGSYIVLWTKTTVLTKQEMKNEKEKLKRPKGMFSVSDAQSLFIASNTLIERHESFIDSFLGEMKKARIRCNYVNVHKALGLIKTSIYPDNITSKWKPVLPTDKFMPKFPDTKFDYSHILWPSLDEQLFDREAEEINNRVVRIGNYLFSGLDMSVGPANLEDFQSLLDRVRQPNDFPWRMSITLEGNGLSGLGVKSLLANILAITSSDNTQIKNAIKILQYHQTQDDFTIVRFRASFATWVHAYKTSDEILDELMSKTSNSDIDITSLNILEKRYNRLHRAIEGWGQATANNNAGDPVAGVFSSALGLSTKSTAPAGAIPIKYATHLMPWNRDTSPWDIGPIIFRTKDGRVFPYTPGDRRKQTNSVDLVAAPPGFSKSVFLATTNLGYCLSETTTLSSDGFSLPKIAILDIGPSQSGFVSLLKESLPDHLKYQVEFIRLRNIIEHSINPFDTQLGCRYPIGREESFLMNFLSLLCTPPGIEIDPDTPGLVQLIIQEIYRYYDDSNPKGKPKKYQITQSPEIDSILDKHNITLEPDTYWWEVVDIFFEKEMIHEAYIAQRYAVPTISDIVRILSESTVIKDMYQRKEELIDDFKRNINLAQINYKLLNGITRFDIGDVKVCAIDMADATAKGSPAADKQTSIVYMLTKAALTRDFYLHEDNISEFNEKYYTYHLRRIKANFERPKRIVYDEFHRTSHSKSVREELSQDMREGRKYNVHVAIASQQISDFDPQMIKLSTARWIMGVGDTSELNEATEKFGLSKNARRILQKELKGPTADGAPFLAILDVKGEQKHEHYVFNTLGPIELWAFSTTPDDVSLRTILYRSVGPKLARKMLSTIFPKGSAIDLINEKKQEIINLGKEVSDEGVINDIAQEVIHKYEHRLIGENPWDIYTSLEHVLNDLEGDVSFLDKMLPKMPEKNKKKLVSFIKSNIYKGLEDEYKSFKNLE